MNSNGKQKNRSHWRILVVGTGGQGVLTMARLLCECFVERGHDVVSGQLHGMAQRGGSVQASVIIDGGISPVIPTGRADFIVGLEPVETVRALPFMSSDTVVLMNTAPVIPFVLAQRKVLKKEQAEYPDLQTLIQSVHSMTAQTVIFDATRCAIEAGSIHSLNMVMLGCLFASHRLPCSTESFCEAAVKRMPPATREVNTAAFFKGAAFVNEPHAVGGIS